MRVPLLHLFIHAFFGFLAFQGIVLSILIWKKYGSGISSYFVSISILFGSLLVLSIIFWTDNLSSIPLFLQFPILGILLIGPLFYGMQANVKLNKLFTGYRSLHLVPFVIGYALLVSGLIFRFNFQFHLGMACHIVLYSLLNSLLYNKNKDEFSPGRRTLFYSYLSFNAVYLVYEIAILAGSWSLVLDYTISLLMGVSISIMLLKSYLNYDFNFKYKAGNKTLKRVSQEIGDKAHYYLSEEKNFLNGSYRLTDLAKDSGFNVHQLSEALNVQYGGFYKLIHDLRISEAKKLLENTEMQVIEVAYTTGFNNKVSFYNSFKRDTGTTPQKWREQRKSHSSYI